MTPFWQAFLPLLFVGATCYWAGVVITDVKWQSKEKKRLELRREVERHAKK
jgi:hypothetical protein